MGHSSKPNPFEKPRPDFPLFPHRNGRWAKKVRGKFQYFGKCADDPDGAAALNLWLDTKDELLAGRTPRGKSDGFTIRDLCNHFLTAKEQKLESGELSPHSFRDYKRVTGHLIHQFGKGRLVIDLTAGDFQSLRASIAKTRGPVAIGNEVQRVRTIFRYAYEAGLIEQPVRFGPEFKKPNRKDMRIARAKAGPKMFEASEVKAMLDKAGPQLRCMMMLALNAGFGNQDCATLPIDAVDLERGWINFPRPKTGIDRRCPLWPETIAAIEAVLAKRKEPKDVAHAGLVFVTKPGGTYIMDTTDSPISKEFAKLVKVCGLKQNRRNFYALRHTFRTIADGCRDFPAIDKVMGHADESMADRYRERIDDGRLVAVVAHVHEWLFPPKAAKATAKEIAERKMDERAAREVAELEKRRALRTAKKGPATPPDTKLITGETYAVRDRLKAMGGKWDPKAKGWMVPAEVADMARMIVAEQPSKKKIPNVQPSSRLAFQLNRLPACSGE